MRRDYAHNNLGALYEKEGRYSLAQKFFRQALTLNPQEKLFQENLFRVLRERSILYRILRWPDAWFRSFVDLWKVRFKKSRILSFLVLIFVIKLSPVFAVIFGSAFLIWVFYLFPFIRLYEWLNAYAPHEILGIKTLKSAKIYDPRRWKRSYRILLFTVANLFYFTTHAFLLIRHPPLYGGLLCIEVLIYLFYFFIITIFFKK